MAKRPPKLIALDHDDCSARYVGRTKGGQQFFLTEPFVPAIGDEPGREFIALYLFDSDGGLMKAWIEDMGTRVEMDEHRAHAIRGEMLTSLGNVAYQRIKIAPFRVERFGVEFGFIAQPPEESGEDWSVIVEPGNYMCFWPPWTSGDYDT
jgi:hypothetical protein